jgi:pilus assembly protein CpaC
MEAKNIRMDILRISHWIGFLSLFVLAFVIPCLAWAQGPQRITLETGSTRKLTLTVGKSVILLSTDLIKRVSMGTPEGIPEIVVPMVLTPNQIYLMGKTPGVTNLTIWGMNGKVSEVIDLEVSPDVSRLKEMIRKIMPEEKNIEATATHDNITLSGAVSNTTNLNQVLALAEPFFPKKVVNILKFENSPDVSKFKEALYQIIPEEKDIKVTATGDNKIAVSGTVSSKTNLSKVLALSESYFPKHVLNLLQAEGSPSQLKEAIYKILPEEKDIRVTPTGESVTLSGTVSSTSNLSQVMAMAESYYPKKVVNILEVGGVHQVMLEVRVAEMSRSLMRRLGVNFNAVSDNGINFGLSMLGSLTRLGSAPLFPSPAGFATAGPVGSVGISNSVNALFRFTGAGATWTTFIDALKEDGLIKVMAEPTLITMSGKSANFLAGGEFPIPIPGADGTITIQYKPFGVGLNFSPVVLSSKKISMQVAPEVSELDFSIPIQIGGFVIPALTTRRVSTTVELGDGQSFAIAGLLKENVREVVSKFPLLGDIPILGVLFRSTSFQKNETELIIIVTPRLVKPMDLAKQTLPTDQYIEPNDFEFYLLGAMEGNKKEDLSAVPSSSPDARSGMKLEGEFGHATPK